MKISGTVIFVVFHELDNLRLSAQVRPGELYLFYNLRWSDRHHHLAAVLLARKTQLDVIWQDITGTKHFVNPKTKPGKKFASLDPRCRQH